MVSPELNSDPLMIAVPLILKALPVFAMALANWKESRRINNSLLNERNVMVVAPLSSENCQESVCVDSYL